MANVINSPNMNLPVPQVGIDAGPDWATQLNNCMALIDQHMHAPGYGVQITPAGLNISTDLTFLGNNATNLRSTRFTVQGSPLSGAADLASLYFTGVDLYANDASGNQIQITKNGGIAGTSGSIANLTSPASASYVSSNETFVWQSAASTPANMDGASYILRNLVANSHGLTLAPPNSMASNYTLTLPSIPVSQSLMTLDSSGNMAAPTVYPLTAAGIANATITSTQIASQTIAQGNLAVRATGTSVAVGGVASSASSGSFSTASGSPVPITNLSVTIVTTGRPVMVMVGPYQGGSPSNGYFGGTGVLGLYRNSTIFTSYDYGPTSGSVFISFPSTVMTVDFVAAGTYTYTASLNASLNTTYCNDCILIAYEL